MHRLSQEPLNGLKSKGHAGELARFLAQHKVVCEKILAIRGVATVERQLVKAIPDLGDEMIETGRTWVNIIPPTALAMLKAEGGFWPLFVNLYRVASASRPHAPKFNLRLVWKRSVFESTRIDEAGLREHVTKYFAGLKAFEASDTRRLVLEKCLSLPEAVEAAKRAIETVEAALKSYPGS